MLLTSNLLDMPRVMIEARLSAARAEYNAYVNDGGVVESVDHAERLLMRVVMFERLLARAGRR